MDEKEAKEIEKELRKSGDCDVFYNYEIEHNGNRLTLTTEETTIYQVCLTKAIRVKNEFKKWIRIDTDEDGKLQIIIHD